MLITDRTSVRCTRSERVQDIRCSALPGKTRFDLAQDNGRLAGLIKQPPLVAIDGDLLPQRRRHLGKAPAPGRPYVQVARRQHADQCRADLDPHGALTDPDEGLDPQRLFDRRERDLSGKGLLRC